MVMLIACSSSGEKELDNYIQTVKARKARPIEPIPSYIPHSKFAYPETDHRRDPFKQKELVTDDPDQFAPDITRPKAPLEAFPLDALKFVGILQQGPHIWGLVSLPTGEIVRVRPGDYMGKDYGKIIRITQTTLVLEERIRVSGKWQKKETVFNLNASSTGARS